MRALLDNPGIDHKLVYLGFQNLIGCRIENARSTLLVDCASQQPISYIEARRSSIGRNWLDCGSTTNCHCLADNNIILYNTTYLIFETQ